MVLKLPGSVSLSFEISHFKKDFPLKASSLFFLKQPCCWESSSSSHTAEAKQSSKDYPEETNVEFRQKRNLLENSDSKRASDFSQYLLHFQLELQGKVWREKITT